MNCCCKCFKDASLVKTILSSSQNVGKCDFCSTPDINLISCEELSIYFETLFDLYTPYPNANGSLKVNTPFLIHEHIDTYWPQLFNHELLDSKIIKFLVDNIAKGSENYDDTNFLGPVQFKSILQANQFPFDSLELQWDSFANDIKFNNRFFLNKKLDTDLLQSVFERLGKTHNSGAEFFRARISDTLLMPGQLGKPPINLTTGGRANPVGIPYLYLSNDLKTTLFETRISLHETLTIGRFISIDHINFISLANIALLGPFEIQDKGFSIEEFIGFRPYIQKLESELSRPVRKQDVHLDYLPTQFLCEFFKSLGFDAVEYKSAMNPDGSNIALFNDAKVTCIETKLYQVNKLEYNWDEL